MTLGFIEIEANGSLRAMRTMWTKGLRKSRVVEAPRSRPPNVDRLRSHVRITNEKDEVAREKGELILLGTTVLTRPVFCALVRDGRPADRNARSAWMPYRERK
jgi:hypothetical protein